MHVAGHDHGEDVDGADGRDRQLSSGDAVRPRLVEVAPERLERWLDGFAARHGDTRVEPAADLVVVVAADGARAEVEVPFPPLAVDTSRPWSGLLEHAARPRRLGIVLVRLGGFAAAVVEGSRPTASTVGSRPVHGRAAAGGWSQKRFARRREGQARTAIEAAAEAVARIVAPQAATLDAVLLGGDRRALRAVLDDPRLARLRPLVVGRVLDVPDPDRRVLGEAVERGRAVRIRLLEP